MNLQRKQESRANEGLEPRAYIGKHYADAELLSACGQIPNSQLLSSGATELSVLHTRVGVPSFAGAFVGKT
jgi:hypothetical protein